MSTANDDKQGLDASSDIPLYRQLYRVLQSKIKNSELRPNDKIPSERSLAATYGISRYTVRKAIDLLLAEGLAYRQHGRGIYVSPVHINNKLKLTGFSEQMERYGIPHESQVACAQEIKADEDIAGHLDIDAGDTVYALKRIRLLGGKPLGVEWAYLPLDYLSGLTNYDFSEVSLYETLEKELGIQLDHAEQTIRAREATPEELGLLNLENPGVVLELQRETYDEFARVIEYCLSAYHPERYTLTVFLSRG